MILLSIGLTEHVDKVKNRLYEDCELFSRDGFRIGIDENIKGNLTFLHCKIVEGELSFRNYERIKGKLKNYIAKTIADVIVNYWEGELIRKIVDENYYYFTPEERDMVFASTYRILNADYIGCEQPALERRNKVLKKVTEYLTNHYEIVLEGFINFRLKDYRQELADAVEKAVDDFMMEREYKEFIRLLRYFVDVQEPRVEEVHVIVEDNGVFKLVDSRGKVINNQYLEGFVVDTTENEINYEDLLISALITIAPHNIMLHSAKAQQSSEVVETIKSVFDGRVLTCEGCDLCKLDSAIKTTKK